MICQGKVTRAVPGIKDPVRTVFEVTGVCWKKGQQLLVPDIRVRVLVC